MQAFALSTAFVALAEIGDKTQLLAFLLAARFRQPLPIVAGILLATILNHLLAAAAGVWLAALLTPEVLRWVLGLAFLAMAAWMLIPDRLDADASPLAGWGVFGTTVVTFFLAEMGDKTQIATVVLAARFDAIVAVTLGTTLGMLVANVPAVYLGDRLAHRLPVRIVHGVAASVCVVLGLATLFGLGRALGV